MSENETPEEEIDWSKIEPCSIEDVTVDNYNTKKMLLDIETKNGGTKKVFVEFKKLDIKEAAIMAKFEFSADGNLAYQRKLLSLASLVPKFPDPTEPKKWENIDSGFAANYAKKIQLHANKDNFL